MKIDEIIEEWQKDAKIDDVELDTESLNVPMLHAKYLKIYATEKVKMI